MTHRCLLRRGATVALMLGIALPGTALAQEGTPPAGPPLPPGCTVVADGLVSPRFLTIGDGDVLYVDYWVVKFDDKFVEQGNDPLRGASICLLRRLFGEYQQPSEGEAVDTAGKRPAAYGQGAPLTDFESDLWRNFWHYANDRAKAEMVELKAWYATLGQTFEPLR